MNIVFITNFINHHQAYLADGFYNLLGDNYKFIETMQIPQWLIDSGYPVIERPYIINGYESKESINKALEIVYKSDVVIIGSAPDFFIKKRIDSEKLTFRYNERWFKSRPWFLTGPRGWLDLYKNHIRYKNYPLYMLCASAYTSKDVNQVGAYINKCFRWGYFTKVDDIAEVIQEKLFLRTDSRIRIIWCARFLRFKHPELPIKLAARLKLRKYEFVIDMYGTGEEFETTKKLAMKLGVEDVVNFCGNRPNEEILKEMRKHDIFLFTSDRNEGWGAVLNEAMSNGCAVVGSDEIGSVPFLIEDGVNGLIFKSRNLDSLEEKVVYLIDHPEERNKMAQNAYNTMREVWSPENAARQFLQLVEALKAKDESLIPSYGPGSKI